MASDILTLNAGSSSLKFSLWQAATDTKLRELFRGEIEKIGIVDANRRSEHGAAMHDAMTNGLEAVQPLLRKPSEELATYALQHGRDA